MHVTGSGLQRSSGSVGVLRESIFFSIDAPGGVGGYMYTGFGCDSSLEHAPY